MALYVNNLLELFKYFISMPAIFGAPIWLGFMWRRLSRNSVIIQIVVSFIIIAVMPNLFQSIESTRTFDPFLKQTKERQIIVSTKAVKSDMELGTAEYVGQKITKTRIIPAYPIYFESVARDSHK